MSYRQLSFFKESASRHSNDPEFTNSIPALLIANLCLAVVIIFFITLGQGGPMKWMRILLLLPALIGSFLFLKSEIVKSIRLAILNVSYFIIAINFLSFIYTTANNNLLNIYYAGIVICICSSMALPLKKSHALFINLAILILVFLAPSEPPHNYLYILLLAVIILLAWAVMSRIEKMVVDTSTSRVLLEQERVDMKKLREKLERADTLKSRLLSIITHDLKGPAKNTAAILQLVNSGSITQEEIKSQMKKLEVHMQSNLLLLENLLKWSLAKIDNRQQIKEVNLHDLVEECIDLMADSAEEKENKIINYIPSVLIETDAEVLKIIVRNLLSNAIKFTYRGTITCSYENSDMHLLTVRDTGVGMEKEDVNRLFDWSKRTSTRGTHDEKGAGIGLLISGEFLESLNGCISIQTHPGKGTAVSIGLKRIHSNNHILM